MIDTGSESLPESAQGVAEVFAEADQFFDEHPEVAEKLVEHGIISDSDE